MFWGLFFAFSTQNRTRSNKYWVPVKFWLCPFTMALLHGDSAVPQCSTYEALPINVLLSSSRFGWIKMKSCSPTIFPAHRTILLITENKFIAWNYIFSDPVSIYLFEFSNNNGGIKCEICSNVTIKATDVLVSLNIFDTFLGLFLAELEHVNARWNTLMP